MVIYNPGVDCTLPFISQLSPHHTKMSSLHTLLLLSSVLLEVVPADYENSCETVASTIHLVREEYTKGKELVRSCEDEVGLSKCEGYCVSTTAPSAMERSGFSKDCSCCRETSYSERTVTLHHCYDQDGHRTQDTMQVTIKEPAGCLCFKCGAAPL